MARSKLDNKIEEYQLKLQERTKEGQLEKQLKKSYYEELNWLSGVIYGLKIAKNI